MTWVFFALLAPALWAATNIFDKVLRERYIRDTVVLTIFLGTIYAVFVTVLFVSFGVADIPFLYHFLMFLTGLVYVVAVLCFIKSLSLEETSRVVPFLQLIPVVVFLFAIIFLGERLFFLQYLAFLFILAGGFFIVLKKDFGKIRVTPAFWFLIGDVLILAGQQVMFKFLNPKYPDFWHALPFYMLGIFVGMSSLLFVRSYRERAFKQLKTLEWKGSLIYLFDHIFSVGALVSFLYAISIGPVSLVSVMGSTQPLFVLVYVLIASRWWGKHLREELKGSIVAFKFFAILLILVGVSLLTLNGGVF